jgi:glutathione S-transferase
MSLTLYAHPFSSYCWKALIGLYETDIPFTYRHMEHEGAGAELAALWPFGRFPLLVDDGRTVVETSIILEHLCVHQGAKLIPVDADLALEARFMDRFFDNDVMTPMNVSVSNALRPEGSKDPYGVDKSLAALERAYGWLEGKLEGRTWAVGETFTIADCAAAPALFYADWVLRIGDQYPTVQAYRARLNARPSVLRCIEEARPYRPYFPLGAPDRD